jgi:hypothetical protein
MKLKEKNYLNLKNINNIKGNKQIVESTIKNEERKGALNILLSGRLGGVSMSRKFITPRLNKTIEKKVRKNKEKIQFKKLTQIESKTNLNTNIIKNNKNIINNSNSAIKPQTINSIETYRLQYTKKDINTK